MGVSIKQSKYLNDDKPNHYNKLFAKKPLLFQKIMSHLFGSIIKQQFQGN